jgi:ankyrin repeat protein
LELLRGITRRAVFDIDGVAGEYVHQQTGRYTSELRFTLSGRGGQPFTLRRYHKQAVVARLLLQPLRHRGDLQLVEGFNAVGFPPSSEDVLRERADLAQAVEALFDDGVTRIERTGEALTATLKLGRGSLSSLVISHDPDCLVTLVQRLAEAGDALPQQLPAKPVSSPFLRWTLQGGLTRSVLATGGTAFAVLIVLITLTATGVLHEEYVPSFYSDQAALEYSVETQPVEEVFAELRRRDAFGEPIAEDGDTALMLAVYEERSDLARALAERGDGVGIPSADGYTPLHLAAEKGELHIARALLAAGADPSQSTSEATPLHQAAGDAGPQMVRLMLEHGAAVDATDDKGMTPLYWVADTAAVANAEVLLAHGADPNRANANGWAPVHVALEEGSVEMVETLLAHGGSPRLKGPGGQPPLLLAARAPDRLERIRVLLDHGAQLDAADRKGRTLSDWARFKDDEELRQLIERYRNGA